MVAEAQRPLYTSATSAKANRKKTPLTVVEQREMFAELAKSLEIAAKKMGEQVSRVASAGEDLTEYRKEQRAATAVLAKIASGLDTVREATRILKGKSLPPNLHTEPIPRKPVARPKPLNKPPVEPWDRPQDEAA